jgi:two-component system chemotaxis response regulator CheB
VQVQGVTDRLVVVGASAGGVEALARLIAELPQDFPAPVVIVLHIPSRGTSVLPRIIGRAGSLPAKHAQDGEELRPGTVYVAPNDCHVLVRERRLEVVRGPRENGHRPAIDPLFRSAATAYGPGAIAVVLTGTLDDGTAGSITISRHGGAVIVQDPEEAAFDEMPLHVIAEDSPEAVLPVAQIGARLVELVREPAATGEEEQMAEDDAQLEARYAALDGEAIERTHPPGALAPFSCPECGGVLTEVADDAVVRFRCRVGHAYTADVLLDEQDGTIEQALYTALRALEERADLALRIARRFRRNDLVGRAERSEADAEDDLRQAEVVRGLLRQVGLARGPARDRQH